MSVFTSRKTLIADEEQINIMGYDVDELVNERKEAFDSTDSNKMNDFLKKYDVDFIYLVWEERFAAEVENINADLVFENEDSRIYRVR